MFFMCFVFYTWMGPQLLLGTALICFNFRVLILYLLCMSLRHTAFTHMFLFDHLLSCLL